MPCAHSNYYRFYIPDIHLLPDRSPFLKPFKKVRINFSKSMDQRQKLESYHNTNWTNKSQSYALYIHLQCTSLKINISRTNRLIFFNNFFFLSTIFILLHLLFGDSNFFSNSLFHSFGAFFCRFKLSEQYYCCCMYFLFMFCVHCIHRTEAVATSESKREK